jgi:hypothetical protein
VKDLTGWGLRMMELDQRLRPIAKSPVGFTGHFRMALSRGQASPLDEAGIDPAPILREIAQLTSDENKYGMGSTRELLLKSA